MHLSAKPLLFLSSFLGASITSANLIVPRVVEPCLPFNFTYLFTAKLMLGKPSNAKASSPLMIPGGVLINEPIASGTVSGPVVNATIEGGFAHPSLYNNMALQVPAIDLYGVTDDGQAFYIHETGVGSNAAQVTRIMLLEMNINEKKYEQLRDGYILASVVPNANRTIAMVEGYLVENKGA